MLKYQEKICKHCKHYEAYYSKETDKYKPTSRGLCDVFGLIKTDRDNCYDFEYSKNTNEKVTSFCRLD